MYKTLSPGNIGHGKGFKESAKLGAKYGFEGYWFDIDEDSKIDVSETKEILAETGLKAAGFGLPVEYRTDEAAFEAARFSPERIEQIQAAQTAGAVLDLWDQIKLQEKEEKAARRETLTEAASEHQASTSLLDGVPRSLPALMQAQDISRKVVAAGFEWEQDEDVWRQVSLEMEEFKQEATGTAGAEEEFGDILFTLVNVARREGIDAESALRGACHKFRRRWAIMEQYALEDGNPIETYSVEQQEAWWQAAKAREITGEPRHEND